MTPNQNILICPACNGSGKVGAGKCLACQGFGAGVWRNGRFLYWNKIITKRELQRKKIEKFLKTVLTGATLIFGLGAILFLGWKIWIVGFAQVFDFSFWISGRLEVILFLLSLVSDFYLIYQFSLERALTGKVEKREYSEKTDERIKAAPVGEITDWAAVRQLPAKEKINVTKTLSLEAEHALVDAWKAALKFGHAEVSPLHIFGALLFSGKSAVVFGRLGVNLKTLQEKIIKQLSSLPPDLPEREEPRISPAGILVFFESYFKAYEARREQIDIAELLLSTAESEELIQEVLYSLEVDLTKLQNVVEWLKISELLRKKWKQSRALARLRPGGTMSRAMTAMATPYLDQFSRDLTLMAKFAYLAPCVDREKEAEEIMRIIEGGHQSVILIGHPGVGKNTIIEGIAERMLEEDVPKILQDKRLIGLNVGQLVAGATPAEAQERLLIICDEIARAGNIVLYIQDIEGLIGITAGAEESVDLSRVLADELSKGYFFVLATATSANWSKHIESSSLGNVLQKVEVKEPEVNEAIQILEAKVGGVEYQNKVIFSYDALSKAVTLSDRYLHERFLPEKAIEILRESAHYTHSKKGEGAVVAGEDVAEVVAQKTKIPVTAVTEGETEKLLRLEEVMHHRVIGQDEAVKMVAAALRRSRAELREGKRPIANFLFLGPTGVGKTETAKTVAEVYFGSEENMVRLDMSEYQDQASIYKLIGAPAGNSPGFLTEAIRKNPFTLLLLDEIEKAHPDILNVFLQVMDDGRLTDNQGRTIDFTSVILIATSNAGSPAIQEGIRGGLSIEAIKDRLINTELKPYFRPEFLNRFDGVVVYKPLTETEIETIARLMLDKIAKQLENKHGIIFEVTPEGVAALAAAGFDPVFGARPLRRVIQEKVEDGLANLLLTKQVGRRDKIILEADGNFKVEKAREL
ncbi:MAG: AAA family ATPase [Patescibacteria group bacterium]|jgi:ATP-dependent Clp protease ATP-binding subunit ClpC